jgi:hypothetical protein
MYVIHYFPTSVALLLVKKQIAVHVLPWRWMHRRWFNGRNNTAMCGSAGHFGPPHHEERHETKMLHSFASSWGKEQK